MQFTLRDYQQEAVDATFSYFRQTVGNPILVLPTGAGKSIIIAEICKRVMEVPATRVLVVTHVKELVEQNHSKVKSYVDAGIYSAGVGRRDRFHRLTFCGIQSVYKKASIFGKVDLVIIDECHLVSPNQETMYRSFLDDLQEVNPDLCVLGLSATPYRTKDGVITEHEGAIFNDICYEVPLTKLIKDGYLCPLITKSSKTQANMDGVKTVGNDFNLKQMAHRFDNEEITRAATSEIIAQSHDRNSVLIFCSSVEHCYHVADYLPNSAVITGATDKAERKNILSLYKMGQIKYLLNYGVLTTGFDAPRTDVVVLLRATQSTSLYVQMLGRGMRISPETAKQNCLVLDYGGNILRHGCVDQIQITSKATKQGIKRELSITPVKICPSCRIDSHVQSSSCVNCGYQFPIEVTHDTTASDAAILSEQIKPEEFKVDQVVYSRHKKQGRPDSLKVTYFCGIRSFSEWICLEHEGYARRKACQWWIERHNDLAPETIEDALKVEPIAPSHIEVRKGKYDEIVGYRYEKESSELAI